MRYAIFEINPYRSYGITIGSRVKPDSTLRERIQSQIDTAMEALERISPQTHRIAIIHDGDISEIGVPEVLPYLKPYKQYLIFAILYSRDESREPLAPQDLESYRKELLGMFEGILGSTRGALVLLQDCSVSILETEKDTGGVDSGGTGYIEMDWDRVMDEDRKRSSWR